MSELKQKEEVEQDPKPEIEAKEAAKEAKKEVPEETPKPEPKVAQKQEKKAEAEVKAKPKAKDTKQKEEKPKGVERFYTFNLRRAYEKPRKKRAKSAVKILRELIARHMKAANVKISNSLNAVLWKHSAEKPPRKVKVKVRKHEDMAEAELA